MLDAALAVASLTLLYLKTFFLKKKYIDLKFTTTCTAVSASSILVYSLLCHYFHNGLLASELCRQMKGPFLILPAKLDSFCN